MYQDDIDMRGDRILELESSDIIEALEVHGYADLAVAEAFLEPRQDVV